MCYACRYAQLEKYSYAIEEMQRLSLLSYHDRQREREDFDISCDDFLSNSESLSLSLSFLSLLFTEHFLFPILVFLELMVNMFR